MLDRVDFQEQVNVASEDGALRPDLIVRLPGGKSIIVDAKAPLSAYLDSLEMADDETRARKLEDHAKQIRDHIHKLSREELLGGIRHARISSFCSYLERPSIAPLLSRTQR
jgi:DNA recombination protein RmuC